MKIVEPGIVRSEASKSIEQEVRARYEERLQKASWWQRIVLAFVIHREANREMKQRFPPTHLYLQRG